jgi:hypothetical protein
MSKATIEEYRTIREEVVKRAKALHQMIILATILEAVFLIAGIWIYANYGNLFAYYLVFIPIVFAGLVFNYQDNQKTLESLAGYIRSRLGPKLDNSLGWDEFFGEEKAKRRLSNGYKVFALLMPFLIPIVLLIYTNISGVELTLAYIDLVLFALILINFRYKLGSL